MSYSVLRPFLPRLLSVPLFGDREAFGQVPDKEDPVWLEWEALWPQFYVSTQRDLTGQVVLGSGYRVSAQIELSGKRVLEVGPGDLQHATYWNGKPAEVVLIDRRQEALDMAKERLSSIGVPYREVIIEDADLLKAGVEESSIDVIFSFYSLEHLHPLDEYVSHLLAVLRPGGLLVGAVPCEGGLAWGLGRYLTTRRYLLRKTTIEPDKIICWEHPNFCDQILRLLDSRMRPRLRGFWPLRVPLLDINLVARFVYEKDLALR